MIIQVGLQLQLAQIINTKLVLQAKVLERAGDLLDPKPIKDID